MFIYFVSVNLFYLVGGTSNFYLTTGTSLGANQIY